MKRILIMMICVLLMLMPVCAFAQGDGDAQEDKAPQVSKEPEKESEKTSEEEQAEEAKPEKTPEQEKPKEEKPKEENNEKPQEENDEKPIEEKEEPKETEKEQSEEEAGDPSTDEEMPQVIVSAGQLSIDGSRRYEGMNKTYKKGYIPVVKDGKATIVLPLVGKTFDHSVTLTVDLGATTDSPFVFGNYSQTLKKGEPYVFTVTIPLAKDRLNGIYPVVMNASYIDVQGSLMNQSFTIYVTIKDGKNPSVPTMEVPSQETVRKPELYISGVAINPATVSGEEEFSVAVTVENIGDQRAKNILLTYNGASAEGSAFIIPAESNNTIHLEDLKSGKLTETSFKLRTTKDIVAGNQPFAVTLDYCDAYGGVYQTTRQFLVNVVQPSSMKYDSFTVPKQLAAGETLSLPANVFNTGKSTLRNVTISVTGAGLFPTSSVFLGDILPGEAGSGEMSVFIGMLSMSEGHTQDYGHTQGVYTITYTDDTGEDHIEEVPFELEITQPVIDNSAEEEAKKAEEEEKKTVGQWWVTILAAFAIIAIILCVIIVSKFARMMKMK